mmetsp:Transcript_48657/g.86551  ORF Transcript_48657/g.86551 Transcript_48657/m.86551 type:complete len:403 (-) Transcript_48657:380-1588(-)
MPKQGVVKVPETPPVWDQDLMETIDKTIGPDFTDDPQVKKTGKLQGTRYKLTMSSKDSKIYPGVAPVKGALKQLEKLDEDHEYHVNTGGIMLFKCRASNAETPEISKPEAYKRQVEVFVPEGVDTSTPSPLMIFLDGAFFEMVGQTVAPWIRRLRKFCCCCGNAGGTFANSISFMNTMDNLFKAEQLKPMVCIFLDPGQGFLGSCIWGSQRNLEYDSLNNKFTDFVEQEVLPLVSEKCKVKLTTDPEQRAVMGMSSGGVAAITMGLTGRFKRILTSSPSCVNLGYPYTPQAQGAWDYHSGKELIKNGDKVEGLRVVVVSNELDMLYQSDVKHCLNWTAASLRMAKALKEKGYACLHIFAKQGIHIDERAMAQCFPEAVKWIWSDISPRTVLTDNFVADKIGQ